MPSNSATRYAVDSSFAIALLDVGHPFYAAAQASAGDHPLALAGHAAFETYSVLSRMPGALQMDPGVLAQVLEVSFPEFCPLSARGANRLFGRLAELGIIGGAVFDALVAAAALENDRTLLSFDPRAERVYRKIGVTYELVGG